MTEYSSDRTIGQLTPGTQITNADQIPVWTNNGTVRFTASQFAAYIAQGVPNPPSLPAWVRASRTSNWTFVNSPYLVPWQAVTGNETNAWSAQNPTRLTVPAGYTHTRLTLGHSFKSHSTSARFYLTAWKNGAAFPGNPTSSIRMYSSGGGTTVLNTASSILAVTPGDYFEMHLWTSNAAARETVAGNDTWFTAEFFN